MLGDIVRLQQRPRVTRRVTEDQGGEQKGLATLACGFLITAVGSAVVTWHCWIRGKGLLDWDSKKKKAARYIHSGGR
jgi:hypothetical protein